MVLDYLTLGRRIRDARKTKQWTQEKLAENAEISTSFMGHIERGSRKASVETLLRIATALGVSTDFLLARNTIPIAENEARDEEIRRVCDGIYSCVFHALRKAWNRA